MKAEAREGRRPLLIGATVLVVLIGSVPALAQGDPAQGADAADAEISAETISALFEDPAFKNAMEVATARRERMLEQRASQAAAEARRDSATSYQNQTAQEAEATALEAHAAAVEEPTNPLSLPEGGEVEQYLGGYAARIDLPTPSDALIESTVPLRATSESGQLAPVDHTLTEAGNALEPKNPLAAVRAYDGVANGLLLPDIDLSVTPHAASGGTGVRKANGTAFYANTYEDTDLLVRPLLGGAEVSYQLRSVESPEAFSLGFHLPAGAELQQDGDDVIVVADDGSELALVTRPVAWDADGWQVPVSYRLSGDDLVMEIEHRGGDWAYPLLLDPSIIENQRYWHYYDGVDFTGWGAYVSPSGAPFQNLSWQSHDYWGRGLYTDGFDWGWYGAFDNAAWFFHAPGPASFIFQANMDLVRNNVSNLWGPAQTHLMTGTADIREGGPWGSAGLWDNGTSWEDDGSGWGPSPLITSTDKSWRNIGHYPSNPQLGNSVLFMTFMGGDYPGQAWENFTSYLGGAETHIGDEELPQMSSPIHTTNGSSGLPSGWIDTADFSVVTRAQDGGLGVKQFKLIVPGYADKLRTHACLGDRTDRCPISQVYRSDGARVTGNSFTYRSASSSPTMPEGVNTVKATAKDLVGNWSQNQTWQIRVDRTPPAIDLSGPLKEASDAGTALDAENYRLDITATDGNRSEPRLERSGVRSIYVSVDGETQYVPDEQTCTHAQGSCPYSDSWTFQPGDYPPGDHTVTVTAMDQLGHVSQRSFPIRTARDFPADEQEPTMTLTTGPPASDGSYDLRIQADDAGTGVRHADVYVDEVLVQSYNQQCPNGGCSFDRTRRMNGAESLAEHEILVDVEDGRGNQASDSKGDRDGWSGLFGYNDNFAVPLQELPDPQHILELTKVLGGKGEVIRFPIDWCLLANLDDSSEPTPRNTNPENWHWGYYRGIFEAIASFNGQGLQDRNQARIKVVPHLGDAPPWATGGQRCGEDPNVITPPLPENEPHWGTFASEFASRFGAPKYGIIGIELWNEPNEFRFWGGSTPNADRFARLVNRAATEINGTAYGGEIAVLPGAISPLGQNPSGFLWDMLRFDEGEGANLADSDPINDINAYIRPESVEAVSIHLYANFAPKDSKALNTIQSDWKLANRRFVHVGLGSRPDWITEIGFPSTKDVGLAGPTASPPRQCRRLRDSFEFLRSRTRMFIVHRLNDTPPPEEPENYGVFKLGGTEKKPAYDMMAWLTSDTGPQPRCRN